MPYVKKGFGPALERNYDKVIFGIALAFLVISVVLLFRAEGQIETETADFDANISRQLKELDKKVASVETNRFLNIERFFETPFRLSTNKLFLVAQERVKCYRCGRPIPYEAEVCGFCGERQPTEDGIVVSGGDTDGDGIPDEYEAKYPAFLNPLDPADALQDGDGDGFTNLEEFQASTDPGDAANHPPRVAFLKVRSMAEARIDYSLRGSVGMGAGKYKYQIKNNRTNQDFYVPLEGEIADPNPPDGTKYKVVSVEVVEEMRMKAGYSTPRPVQVPVITISNGTVQYTLKEGDPVGTSGDVRVTFVCPRDTEPREYVGQIRQTFAFDDDVFTVLEVDRKQGSALIRRNSDQKEFRVPGE